MALTREQFENDYAQRSRTTVERLREWGRDSAPCDCGQDGCEGWQMAYRDMLERDERELDHMLPRDRDTLAWLRAHERVT